METDNGTNYIQEGIAEHEREREAEITRLNKVVDAMARRIANENIELDCKIICKAGMYCGNEACIHSIRQYFYERTQIEEQR